MKKVALVCKLMPHYRLGVFHELSKPNEKFYFTCFGDTKKQGGIEIIPWSLANRVDLGGVNWIRTSNYFYYPERLLWQTGIVRRILFSDYKYFIFEGAIAHFPTWLFAFLCRVSGKKALFWTHGFKGTDRGIKKIIRTIYFKLAHGLLLYGNYSKKIMAESGFDKERLFVIYNSLNLNKQLETFKKSDRSISSSEKIRIFSQPNALTLIFIGRLVQSKNIRFIVQAVKDLVSTNTPINAILIGTGPEEDFIKEFILKNQLENNIHLPGAIYDEETICKYFMMSDLLISPGGVGLNCMHSLAYGVPVLTHNEFTEQSPEVEAIVPQKTGDFFKYNDYDDMLEKVRSWNNFGISKEDVIKNCHNMLKEKFTPEVHAQNIINGLESLSNNFGKK